MQGITNVSPQQGKLSRLRFIAKYWYEPRTCLEYLKLTQKSLDRLRQIIKSNYPEILVRNNPLAASRLAII